MDDSFFRSIRQEYTSSIPSLEGSPLVLAKQWLAEAIESGIPEANAFHLTTINLNQPQSRVVLIKDFIAEGPVFFTNYHSQKGQSLAKNPNCCGHFWWQSLERQVRFEGQAVRVSRAVSEEYFRHRTRGSQLGAWASEQSSVLSSFEELEGRLKALEQKFEGQEIPCPPFWGGYCLVTTRLEFWVGRPSRLHWRKRYSLNIAEQAWTSELLSP